MPRTAMKDFEEVTNKRIHEILSGVTGSLGFYDYTQHPVAYVFALSLNGRLAEAKQELEKLIERPNLSESE